MKPPNIVCSRHMRVDRVLLSFGVIVAAATLLQRPAQAGAPCCAITAIEPRTGIVTAHVKATGEAFQFRAANPALLQSLKVGQAVYVNLKTGQVSLDGKTACCAIVSEERETVSSRARVPTRARPAGDSQAESSPGTSEGAPKVGDDLPTLPSTTAQLRGGRLATLSCTPLEVPGGKPFSCTVTLEGRGALRAARVDIASSNTAVAWGPRWVDIPADSRTASFSVHTNGLPQSAAVTMSASYGGANRTAALKVLPAAIESFRCGRCELPAGETTPLIVRLTAPAPAGGYKVRVDSSGDLIIPEGKNEASRYFRAPGVPESTSFEFSLKDPITGLVREVHVRVRPASIRSVSVYPSSLSQVPLGGKEVTVMVNLSGPGGNRLVDVQYGGTTDIKGPAQLRLTGETVHFKATVSPCGLNPPCTALVKVDGRQATASVNP